MTITIFLFSHSENFFIPFMCNTALFHLRLWLHQNSGKTSSPSATASSRNSLGMVTLNQNKGETKTTQNTPDKATLPLFYSVAFHSGQVLGLAQSTAVLRAVSRQSDPGRNSWDRRCFSSTAAAKAEPCLRPQWSFIGSYNPLWDLHQYFTPALTQWGKGTDLRKAWVNPHIAGSTVYLCCNYSASDSTQSKMNKKNRSMSATTVAKNSFMKLNPQVNIHALITPYTISPPALWLCFIPLYDF